MSKEWRGLAAALVMGIAAAGCAQEGKLIDLPLSVRGVAYDQFVDTTIVDTLTRTTVFTTRFKVQVHGENACELSRIQLELSRVGPTGTPIFVLSPIARYNTDDACMNAGNAPGDTTLLLSVNSVSVAGSNTIPFLVKNVEGPDFPIVVDSTVHTPVGTIQFRIKVEDRSDAAAVAGATVALDSLSIVGGAVGPIGTATTNVLGIATFDVASTVPVGKDAFRYQVTVTDTTNTHVMVVRVAPARGQSIERVFVRI